MGVAKGKINISVQMFCMYSVMFSYSVAMKYLEAWQVYLETVDGNYLHKAVSVLGEVCPIQESQSIVQTQ